MFRGLKKILPEPLARSLSRNYNRVKSLGFDYFPGEDLEGLREKINLYFKLFPSEKIRYQEELDFLNSKATSANKFSFILPYDFVFHYDLSEVQVHKDNDSGLYYVVHNGKRLYYSREHTDEYSVKFTYNCIRIEQDIRSPHRYLTDDFNVRDGDVVLDIGAAEGNFALDVVERAGKICIFETDPKWNEALTLTFAPWKDKVEIVNKFVSDKNDDKHMTLSSVFSDRKIDFIKLDVEGAESEILQSSKDILRSNSDLRLAVCTYHAVNDLETIENILSECGYSCTATDGYMLFIYSRLVPPYFRKTLIRAGKYQ